jgi:hypothetical protein
MTDHKKRWPVPQGGSAGDLVAGFGWTAKLTGDKIAGATGSEIFARFEESEVL